MKGIRYNIKTKEIEKVDNGSPLPTLLPVEEIGVDLKELKKLLEYAKSMGWI